MDADRIWCCAACGSDAHATVTAEKVLPPDPCAPSPLLATLCALCAYRLERTLREGVSLRCDADRTEP